MPVYPLDDAAPWPSSDEAPVRWDTGRAAFLVASSRCVRVNKRGIHPLPASWTPVGDMVSQGWSVRACQPGAGALCRGQNYSTFPSTHPVYNPLRVPEATPGCTRAQDGRVLDAGASGYDLSACDVLDGGLDVVLCDHTLALRVTSMDTWIYWAVCILVIYNVRALSYLVALRLRPVDRVKSALEPPDKPAKPPVEAPDDWWTSHWAQSTNTRTAIACLLTWALCVLPDLNSVYVTVEEQLFFVGLTIYILVYASMWAMSTHTEDPPLYNMIVGTVLLAVTRLYAGAETPYTPVLMWAVATRTLMKLRNTYWSRIVAVTIMLDAFLLSLMVTLGFGHNALYALLIGALALPASDVLEIS